MQQKEKERRKKSPKIKKPKDVGHFLVQNFDFCACLSPNVETRNASSKKGELSCFRCIFNQIKANLAEIQPKNHQKTLIFLHRAPGGNGLILVDNDLGKFSFQ